MEWSHYAPLKCLTILKIEGNRAQYVCELTLFMPNMADSIGHYLHEIELIMLFVEYSF